jgi:putative membrane protein
MLSFAISLRTSSALERWNLGRQAWTNMSLASRNLGSTVWIHVGPYTLMAKEQADLVVGSAEEEVEKVKGLIEKRTV